MSLCDTAATANPKSVGEVIESMDDQDVPLQALALHFSDVYGMGLVNVLAGLQRGVATVDAAVAGTGGYPFAKVGGWGRGVSEVEE